MKQLNLKAENEQRDAQIEAFQKQENKRLAAVEEGKDEVLTLSSIEEQSTILNSREEKIIEEEAELLNLKNSLKDGIFDSSKELLKAEKKENELKVFEDSLFKKEQELKTREDSLNKKEKEKTQLKTK